MKKNRLGKTEIEISRLGFGASPFGDIYNRKVTQLEANKMVEYAIGHGINYFDVAPYYGIGLAEEKLGNALPKNTDNLIISTKVGRYGLNEFDFSIKRLKSSVETSLKRLNRDYLDILICHDIEFVDKQIILDQAVPFLEKLKKEGLIRAIGISGLPLSVLKEVATKSEIDVILSYCKYTLLDQSLLSLKSFIKEKKIGLINASPYAMGLLTQNNCPEWNPFKKGSENKVEKIKKEAFNNKKTIEQLAFQYASTCPISNCILTGFSDVEELKNTLSWI